MTSQTFFGISQEHKKIKNFIIDLVAKGIELEDININDFSSSYPYKVYIGHFHRKNGVRIYKRFSQRDVDNCVKWFAREYPTFIKLNFG